MNKILNKQIVANNIKRLEVTADVISHKAKAGQFVMVMADEHSERIPLAVADTDSHRGTISLIFEEVGVSTKRLGALQIGESIFSVLGPLGMPIKAGDTKEVVCCVGYGIGIAQLYTICKAYRKGENKVIGIIGAKTKKSLIFESQMRLVCHKLYATTDDGSYERKGDVTVCLADAIKKENITLVIASGPLEMMRSICDTTRAKKIKTNVLLNTIMVDGIGLCGSCKVNVAGKEVLACVDGPQFDGHAIDFEELMAKAL